MVASIYPTSRSMKSSSSCSLFFHLIVPILVAQLLSKELGPQQSRPQLLNWFVWRLHVCCLCLPYGPSSTSPQLEHNHLSLSRQSAQERYLQYPFVSKSSAFSLQDQLKVQRTYQARVWNKGSCYFFLISLVVMKQNCHFLFLFLLLLGEGKSSCHRKRHSTYRKLEEEFEEFGADFGWSIERKTGGSQVLIEWHALWTRSNQSFVKLRNCQGWKQLHRNFPTWI